MNPVGGVLNPPMPSATDTMTGRLQLLRTRMRVSGITVGVGGREGGSSNHEHPDVVLQVVLSPIDEQSLDDPQHSARTAPGYRVPIANSSPAKFSE
jgi:hypothetical protein